MPIQMRGDRRREFASPVPALSSMGAPSILLAKGYCLAFEEDCLECKALKSLNIPSIKKHREVVQFTDNSKWYVVINATVSQILTLCRPRNLFADTFHSRRSISYTRMRLHHKISDLTVFLVSFI